MPDCRIHADLGYAWPAIVYIQLPGREGKAMWQEAIPVCSVHLTAFAELLEPVPRTFEPHTYKHLLKYTGPLNEWAEPA